MCREAPLLFLWCSHKRKNTVRSTRSPRRRHYKKYLKNKKYSLIRKDKETKTKKLLIFKTINFPHLLSFYLYLIYHFRIQVLSNHRQFDFIFLFFLCCCCFSDPRARATIKNITTTKQKWKSK